MEADPIIPAHQALAPPPSSPPDSAHALQALQAQIVLLDRLAEFGLQIAQAMARQVSPPNGAPLALPAPKLFQGDIALGFSRVARAVRLTIALKARLVGELEAWRRGEAPPAQAAADAQTGQDSEPEPETELETEPRDAVERLGGREREARDDIYALLDRPVGEVIDLICHDLGLSPEWVRQAQEEAARDAAGSAWAAFVARSGDGRSPHAAATPGWRARHDASP